MVRYPTSQARREQSGTTRRQFLMRSAMAAAGASVLASPARALASTSIHALTAPQGGDDSARLMDALARYGTVRLPRYDRPYRLANVQIRSNQTVWLDRGVVIRPAYAMRFGQIFWLSEGYGSARPADRCGVRGGPATLDFTGVPAVGMRGVQIGGATNFVVAGLTGLNIPDGNVVHSNRNGAKTMNQHGIIRRIGTVSSNDGYGCVQLTGGEDDIEIYRCQATNGGQAVILELDGPEGGDANDIRVHDIHASGRRDSPELFGGAFRLVTWRGARMTNVVVDGFSAYATKETGFGIWSGPEAGGPIDAVVRNGTIDGAGFTPAAKNLYAGGHNVVGHVEIENVSARRCGNGFVLAGENLTGCGVSDSAGYGFTDRDVAAGRTSVLRACGSAPARFDYLRVVRSS